MIGNMMDFMPLTPKSSHLEINYYSEISSYHGTYFITLSLTTSESSTRSAE